MIFISKSFRTIVFIFVIFLSNLFNYRFPYCFICILDLLSRSLQPSIYSDSWSRLILQCSALSIISTSSHKGLWFPISFHIWSAIPDFLISPRTTAFWCSSNLTFSERPVSPLYVTTTARYGVNTVIDIVEFCYWLYPEEISLESWITYEYCPGVIWTAYLLDPFG